jgi:hypothetical protein
MHGALKHGRYDRCATSHEIALEPTMTSPTPAPSDPADEADELDTEGHAFTWSADPKDGRKLRQSWTPDDPKDVRTSRELSANERKQDARR